ncbi:MAG: malonic semialdehyde reductase [Maricaulaceae bacterium]
MADPVNDHALDVIWREARTHNAWLDRPVGEDVLHKLYEITKWAPTSANCSPARFLFVQGAEAKDKLIPHLIGPNQDKTRAAPVCVIIAYDMEFFEKVPALFPHNPGARDWFTSTDAAFDNAFRNGTLQGGYLMLAARALGLDCGPMSGFDRDGVDRDFFAGTTWKSNWLCNLGYGDPEKLFPRGPRLDFDTACKIL